MSGEHLLIVIIVGIIAGWLASVIVQGGGMGVLGDLVVGIVGAFLGNWLFAHFHLHLGTGLVGAIVHATIGAILLLIVLRVLTGGFGPGYRRW